jgi:hypothetical protein
MENVSIFYDHLVYFTTIWHNLWPFGLVCGHLVYLSRFLVCLDQEKSGSPAKVSIKCSEMDPICVSFE